jgi:hypothetical protein
MAPLYLEATIPVILWDSSWFTAFQKELHNHMSHISHLGIRAKLFYIERTLKGLISPAPTLESLSLSSGDEKDFRNRTLRQVSVPDTLFDGTTPRLSCLVLRNCDISWKSQLLKGLSHLEIRTLTVDARPKLAVWLDALDEMQQLKTVTLHSASPIAPPFPFDVERTVTLPSLVHLDISASPGDCGLALAHLVLPALTWLCLTVRTAASMDDDSDMQKMLPYVARHAHGPQDTQPLQSALIRSDSKHADILAWPVPDCIDVEVDESDPPVFNMLATTLPTRVALSFTGEDWFASYTYFIEVLGAAMEALPLDNLMTLIVQGDESPDSEPLNKQFWLRHSPRWPLLRRVQLGPHGERWFGEMLLEDNGGRESPLLLSLTELVLVGPPLFNSWTCFLLRDVLMKRVEQGVPFKMLDLRMCRGSVHSPADLRLFSEIVVDVLGPETPEARGQMRSVWDAVGRGLFVTDENPGGEDDGEEQD